MFFAFSARPRRRAALSPRTSARCSSRRFALFAAALGLQAQRVKLDDPARALRLFKSNREAGLLLLLALAAGGWR